MKGLAKIILLSTLALGSCKDNVTTLPKIPPKITPVSYAKPTPIEQLVFDHYNNKGMVSVFFSTNEELNKLHELIGFSGGYSIDGSGANFALVFDPDNDGDYDYIYFVDGIHYFVQQREAPEIKETKPNYNSI